MPGGWRAARPHSKPGASTTLLQSFVLLAAAALVDQTRAVPAIATAAQIAATITIPAAELTRDARSRCGRPEA